MIDCVRFKSVNKGCLQGFADLYVQKWDLEIIGCSVYMKDGRRWINFPSREYTNNEGEKKFAPIVRLKKKENYDAFIDQAKRAIDDWCEKENVKVAEEPEGSDHVEETPF